MKETDRLYSLIGMQTVHTDVTMRGLQQSDHHMLIVITKGSGELVVNGQPLAVHPAHVLVLSPRASWRIDARGNQPLVYNQLEFEIYAESEDGVLRRESEREEEERAVSLPEAPQLARRISSIWDGNRWDRMQANICFQELLLAVRKRLELEQNSEPEQHYDQAHESIQLTKLHMNAHFHNSLTRELLAAMAGMSVAHYSRLFKRIVGQGPMEYLNEVRIAHAGDLLLGTERTIRETANRVGYQDEFYFSRKFKAVTGFSPTVYMKKHRMSSRIASAAIPYTGHLLALGMQPFAALVNPSQEPNAGLQATMEVGYGQPDLDRLLLARPELIISFERGDYAEPDKADLFRHIAPTCTVPFHGEWRDHLRIIGRAVNRTEAAELWLEQYETLAERSRAAVREKIGDRTVAVAQFEAGRFQLFGSRNLGTVLYRDLQLTMPSQLNEVSHSRMVTIEQLVEYDIDHLILFTASEVQQREALRHALTTHSVWRELKAVNSGHIYDLGASRNYSCYTSVSHDLFLRRMTELFMSQMSMR
ncbi:helix-turn-helix domain-containing protein [Paenibacillus sinopodophylli]|uniref:helix-turn-helix domain-containing protein n=1 Tax=Paenibacillus sinopodophylli TaxID=1837342 RepID=UPI00110CFC1E|nr:helix-turn-helix domain-containing protein [Paenibacillus sinopodophylli]